MKEDNTNENGNDSDNDKDNDSGNEIMQSYISELIEFSERKFSIVLIKEVKHDNNNKSKKSSSIPIVTINNNRQINIMNVNQNLKICKNNNNGGSLLINALNNPKSKNGIKNRMLKEQGLLP